MEKLILETTQHGLKAYHKLERFPVLVGRGLDCDVIVSDMTVSPVHLKIDRTAQGYEVQNLSEENGTRLKGELMKDQAMPLDIPTEFALGDLKLRVLSRDSAVAPTRVKSSTKGWLGCLNNPFWAMIFVLLTAVSIVVSRYISTPVSQDYLMYISKVLPALLLMFGLALLIASVSRLSMHRWAFVPAVSIASLFLLLPILLEHLGHFLDYLLTTNWPSTVIEHASDFLLLPALLMLYLVRVHYTRFISAFGIAVLVTMPVTAYLVSDVVDQLSNSSGFSPMPSFNKTLSAMDWRVKETMEVGHFIEQSSEVLDQRVERLLKEQRAK